MESRFAFKYSLDRVFIYVRKKTKKLGKITRLEHKTNHHKNINLNLLTI
ncbi:hypothetical protein FLACOL7796_02363 [Flavobacterium collinsii]|uniref:Uncharacterized protein n=1 Tax=Flavobacterium collinsii TaxID=1114861 RepID=A0ABM8KIY8_9FLAO|nr:hypothetical protein FLACOL7796_02363 [Flavobacterium collinsii]